ncbi:S8 family serine peptidase [Salipiger bermudensis]|uniref:S8 family serine peptidase n=1 Tax=Salipiger bermudensis TaxID=344736 RepID=UPI001C9A122D|nr:S8 family serine peptidase [Salipiger bermudensis]MBY6005202.1 S8 family serine peptidase [Salipiger bermudensis]
MTGTTLRANLDLAQAGIDVGPSSDPSFTRSWFFEASNRSDIKIDVESVWEDYTGEGIKVGVLDSQIDYKHADLKSAYDQTLDYDFDQNTGDIDIRPTKLASSHGTMVAGVIAAEAGNGEGSVGIAYDATLVGLAMNYSSANVVEQALNGIRAGAELDVLNNSWSFTANFADNFSKGSAGAEMEAALAYTAGEGRDGLGTSMVFAAGNSGSDGISNYHNFQNSPYTIAVGGVKANGDAAGFTSIGANVLLSAAGTDVFTTLPNNSYKDGADGTSFAAPAVTAVIALMLEANPELGYRDIQQILAISARKAGLGDGVAHGEGWVTNGAENVNGGGMHFSDSFGYGMLNAHDAVRLAEIWTTQETLENRETLETSVKTDDMLIAGKNDRIEVDINVTEDIEVEHVQLSMNLSWAYTGDLDVWLVSPDGTAVKLMYDLPDTDRVGVVKNFEFSSVATMGEMSAGTWKLVIENTNPDAQAGSGEPMTGSLREVTLKVHGNAESLEDDVYVYTDEFGLLYEGSDLKSRQIIDDSDGGIDTLNIAAVTSDSVIDLSAESASKIAGIAVDIAANTIENVFAGDGDDLLTGSAADNDIRGGRGNDTINFSAGADTIDGGRGIDTLVLDTVIGAVSGWITDAGNFMLGLFEEAVSLISNIEFYTFGDVTYSHDEVMAVLSNDGDIAVEEPEAPAVEAPAPEEPEAPVEQPAEPEAPVAEEPAVEEPVAEEPVAEEPVAEEPVAEEPVAEEPVAEEPEFEIVLSGAEGEDRLRGGDEAEWIEGNEGDDYLVGNGGDDFILGGVGHDKVRAGSGMDSIYGGAGNDTLMGEEGNDYLEGNEGDDILRGDEGDDVLYGGAGLNRLQGGDGADAFVFNLADEGAVSIITDFDAAEGDHLVLKYGEAAAQSSVTFEFMHDGRATYLIADYDGVESVLAEIYGQGVEELQTVEQAGTVMFT